MSNKFFSLIYGEKSKIIPNQKIIPAEAVGLILDAQEVLVRVKQDAEKYKIDVAQECEKLKELAKQEGFAEGYQKWAEHIAKIEEEIIKVRGELEKMLIPVALKAAKKIVGREIELSENTIVDIVSNSLKAVSQHKKITVYVNKKDLDPIEASRPRLKDIFESLEVLSLRERSDIVRGGCVIETEGGIINAQLENQWSALERAFTSLMKKKELSTPPKKAADHET
ncbi:MAG: HrpE/YscL family type III secretion apparatus protein [Parachlamydiaceae bacterium]|nr:HrpE/YscL family type III secretion apparatus protein [Parachlamydiaceae bacterium]